MINCWKLSREKFFFTRFLSLCEMNVKRQSSVPAEVHKEACGKMTETLEQMNGKNKKAKSLQAVNKRYKSVEKCF